MNCLTIRRSLSICVLLVGALLADVAQAQINFQGLDIGGKKAKKQAAKKSGSQEKGAANTQEKDEPDEESTPAPAVLVPAKPVATSKIPPPKPVDRTKITAALGLYKAGNFEQAAVAFYDVSVTPGVEAIQVEAHYWLAKCLYKTGMFHSSLSYFSKVLAKGAGTRFFESSLEWLFFIARKTVNESVVLDVIATYSNAEFPERFKTEFHYLLARYNFVRGIALDANERGEDANQAFAAVFSNTKQIPEKDRFYPQAKYLEGMTFTRNGQDESAMAAMKEVIRTTRRSDYEVSTSKVAKNLQALRELAFMQLARIHYGARQNRNAIFYYRKVERGGSQWLEALFEAAWAHYRIGEYERALGNLVTLSSPIFQDEYYPEALILKAVIYYENCRYPEALAIVDDFEAQYGPVQTELQVLVGKKLPAAQYFAVLDEVQKKRAAGRVMTAKDRTLERILNLALSDKDLKKTVESISELEREVDSISSKSDSFKYSALAKSLLDTLKLQRTDLVNRAGAIAQAKLDFELAQLRTMRANGLRIKFDTVSTEKKFLQEKLASGGDQATVKDYTLKYAVPDDYLYWSFDGEFWRDELGTYQYTLTKGCIELKKIPTAQAN